MILSLALLTFFFVFSSFDEIATVDTNNEYRFTSVLFGPDQDGDGLEDALENALGTNKSNKDSDGDDIPDGYEYCNGLSLLENDAGDDLDKDNLNNSYEFILGLLANNSDTDGDDIPDGYEVLNNLNASLADASSDKDGDEWTNLEEFMKGTDPSDASSYPTEDLVQSIFYWINNNIYGTGYTRDIPIVAIVIMSIFVLVSIIVALIIFFIFFKIISSGSSLKDRAADNNKRTFNLVIRTADIRDSNATLIEESARLSNLRALEHRIAVERLSTIQRQKADLINLRQSNIHELDIISSGSSLKDRAADNNKWASNPVTGTADIEESVRQSNIHELDAISSGSSLKDRAADNNKRASNPVTGTADIEESVRQSNIHELDAISSGSSLKDRAADNNKRASNPVTGTADIEESVRQSNMLEIDIIFIENSFKKSALDHSGKKICLEMTSAEKEGQPSFDPPILKNQKIYCLCESCNGSSYKKNIIQKNELDNGDDFHSNYLRRKNRENRENQKNRDSDYLITGYNTKSEPRAILIEQKGAQDIVNGKEQLTETMFVLLNLNEKYRKEGKLSKEEKELMATVIPCIYNAKKSKLMYDKPQRNEKDGSALTKLEKIEVCGKEIDVHRLTDQNMHDPEYRDAILD